MSKSSKKLQLDIGGSGILEEHEAGLSTFLLLSCGGVYAVFNWIMSISLQLS
jgi:hypothetical protein